MTKIYKPFYSKSVTIRGGPKLIKLLDVIYERALTKKHQQHFYARQVNILSPVLSLRFDSNPRQFRQVTTGRRS